MATSLRFPKTCNARTRNHTLHGRLTGRRHIEFWYFPILVYYVTFSRYNIHGFIGMENKLLFSDMSLGLVLLLFNFKYLHKHLIEFNGGVGHKNAYNAIL